MAGSSRTVISRPEVYIDDAYASDVCFALYRGVREVWADVDEFVDQLFASSATALGFPYWAELLGVTQTYAQAAESKYKLAAYLRRGGMFNKDSLDALVHACTGEYAESISEGISSVKIALPSAVTVEGTAALVAAVEKVRPLHVSVAIVGNINLELGGTA